MSNSDGPFVLNTNNEEFKQRQKNVFDQLGVLEKNNTMNTMEVETASDTQIVEVNRSRNDSNRSDRAYLKLFRGKESIFKTPQNPKPKSFSRRIPDFKKNPHKWTKYSLEDVKDEDISDKGNTRAALSFLKEIENRKIQESILETNTEIDNTPKVSFRRTVPVKLSEELPEDKPSFSSSKVIMPEYIIGQKVRKEKIKKQTVDKGQELKLEHLFEEDE